MGDRFSGGGIIEVACVAIQGLVGSTLTFSFSFLEPQINTSSLAKIAVTMSFYDEIEIEDMTFHSETSLYTYPCPCGDQFEISLMDLRDGEEVAVCPSCSLTIKVIFEAVSPCRILFCT